MTFKRVRVWPLAERTKTPLAHLIQSDEEVLGMTLCGQPARNAMKETPPTDLIGLLSCDVCENIRLRRVARS